MTRPPGVCVILHSMDRPAANVLRVLAIVVISLFLIVATGLLTVAAAFGIFTSRESSDQIAAMGIGLVYLLLLVAGIFAIVKMAKRIRASTGPIAQSPAPDAPITPADRKAIDRLLLMVLAAIIVSALSWIFNLHSDALHQWLPLLLSFFIYQLPYLFLLWRLNKKPDTPAITFALVLPCVAVLWSGYNLITLWHAFTDRPQMLGVRALFSLVDIGIFLLALQVRKLRRTPAKIELFVIFAAATVAYFFLAQFLSQWLFRLS